MPGKLTEKQLAKIPRFHHKNLTAIMNIVFSEGKQITPNKWNISFKIATWITEYDAFVSHAFLHLILFHMQGKPKIENMTT